MTPHSKDKVVTRFAPSPTGPFHIGSLRTALFNFLVARHYGGTMVLRIEDTDRKRSEQKYEKEILDGLSWAGISYDELYRQSEREEAGVYEEYISKLISSDKAYKSEETHEGEKKSVIRFRNPNKEVVFEDIVRGSITFNTEELGDFVIARSVKSPLYHMAVVVDDFLMEVTHVIRGEDHISNTARQILLGEAIGALLPQYAHIPLVLAHDRSKLSKRHGAQSVLEYKEMGYIPEALLNFLALLGWSPSSDKEIFSLPELIELFTLERVQRGGAIFNEEKLRWVNREHLKQLPQQEIEESLETYIPEDIKKKPQYTQERIQKMIPVLMERIDVFSDLKEMHERGELNYFFEAPEYESQALLWKDTSREEAKQHIDSIINMLHEKDEEFSSEEVREVLWDYATEHGRGNVLWPMRYALSGKEKSPDPFSLASILEKTETIKRLEKASSQLA